MLSGRALVSVLIPCRNGAAWLHEAIESALDQEYRPLEIIVVDDASTDDSPAIARGFADRGVRLIELAEARGASHARNVALSASSGDYVQFLDADDLLSRDKITAQVELLEARPERIAVSGTIHFVDGSDPGQGKVHDGWPMIDAPDPAEWLIQLLGGDGEGGMVHPGAWLIPRSVVEAAGPWDESLTLDDDGEFFARVVLASSGLLRSGGYSLYRKHSDNGSLSGSASLSSHRSALLAAERKAELLLAVRDTPRARRALARQFMDRAFLAFPEYPEVSRAAEACALRLRIDAAAPDVATPLGRIVAALVGWRGLRRIQHLRHRRPRTRVEGGAGGPARV